MEIRDCGSLSTLQDTQKKQENLRGAYRKNCQGVRGKTGFPGVQSGTNCLSREEKARLWSRREEEGRPELPGADENRKEGTKEKSETESKILVRPDGSRVLLVTVRQGGAIVRTMSLKLSEPAKRAGDSTEEKTEGERKETGNQGGEGPESARAEGMPGGIKGPEAAGTKGMPGGMKVPEAARAEGIPEETNALESAGAKGMPEGTNAPESAGITGAGGEDA